MLVATQFSGFGSGGKLVQTLIDRTAGTAIGDMTGGGGLAAAFDGNTSQGSSSGALRNAIVSEAFIGKDWGAGVTRKVSGFKAFSSNDEGFVGGGDTPNVTITLQGSSDNFAADINDLGASPGEADPGSSQLIITKLTGINAGTAYRYHRLKIATSIDEFINCAECQFFEDVEG